MRRLITPAHWRPQPWKNGGGVTQELARWPAGEGADDFDIRISLAEVEQSGPFSRFPGYRRWSILTGAAAVTLVTAEATHRLGRVGDHVALDGDVAIAAVLAAGPAQLLNILARPELVVVGVGAPRQRVRFVFALADAPSLPRHHAMIIEPAAELGGRWRDHGIVWMADVD